MPSIVSTQTGFSLGNARGMMWLSQQAYETANEQGRRRPDSLRLDNARSSQRSQHGFPPTVRASSRRCEHDATLVTFAGTDPLKHQDWITDFSTATRRLRIRLRQAVDTVWPKIKTRSSRPPTISLVLHRSQPGGALAMIAASALHEVGISRPRCLHIRRTASRRPELFSDYKPDLGDRTFRLVHGDDIVATVPPSLPTTFAMSDVCSNAQRGRLRWSNIAASDDGQQAGSS